MSPLPSWWSDANDRRKRNARSRAQERNSAAATGGRVQPGSGSSHRAPGDVLLPEILQEDKFTDKGSFALTRALIRDHWRKAALMGREPRILIEFAAPSPIRVYVIPADETVPLRFPG